MAAFAHGERLHAFDQLRALAMLGGVLFHAALAHSVITQPFWPGALGTTSWWVDGAAWLSHLVRMPLFFLVAGYFSAHSVARRGMDGLFRQRARRVLVPLLIAWPLVTVVMAGGLGWAAAEVDAPNAFLRFVRDAAASDHTGLPLGFGHLWFLTYLLLFTVMHWAGSVLGLGRWLDAALALDPRTMTMVLPLLLVLPFALTSAPHPAPESLLPQLWAIALYGPFFLLGVGLHGRLDHLEPLWRWRWPMLVTVLSAHAIFVWQLADGPVDALWPRAAWPIAAAQAIIAGWGTLLLVMVGLRVLRQPQPVLDYLSGSAYTVYLLHLPVLLALQIALLGRGMSGPVAYAIAMLGTMAICLLVYEAGVRRTPLRRWIG